MKYNKFLMALALCVGISTSTSYSALASAPKAIYKGLKYVVGGLGGSAINIPSSIFNVMAGWSVNKTIMIVSAGITILGFWYKQEDIMKWLTNIVWSTGDQQQIKPFVSSQKGTFKALGKSQQLILKEFLEKNNYAVNIIEELQLNNKYDKDLDTVLLQHYYNEYVRLINRLPNKDEKTIKIFLDQEKDKCVFLPEIIATGQKGPMLMTPELGTNRGGFGLRMQAIKALEKDLQEGRLRLTQ